MYICLRWICETSEASGEKSVMANSAKANASNPLGPQCITSSFFSQPLFPVKPKTSRERSNSPVLRDGHQPLKKTKITGTFSLEDSALAGPSRTLSRSGGVAEYFRRPSSSEIPPKDGKNEGEEVARTKRHEAFKKKLVQENSIFVQRKAFSTSSDERMDVEDDHARGGCTEVTGDDSDEAFKALTRTFAKSKGKSENARKRTQNREEVGPSGQTYTPLELQVSAQCPLMLVTTNHRL
jgi:DNA mismatch repair protein MSH3